MLAERLTTVPDLLIGYNENVLGILEETISDRVLKVQQAARNARNKWLEFEKIYDIIEEK